DLVECRARLLSCLGARKLERLFPQSANWLVIVCCVSSHRQLLVHLTRDDHSITDFPLRNFESGYAKRLQTGSHITGHDTEVFADYACSAGFMHDNAEIFFAFALVCFAVFGCVVVAGNEMRCAAAGSFQHLLLIERQEFFVSLRSPGKGVNAIKSLDVIDSEKMKDPSSCAHPFAPPLKI